MEYVNPKVTQGYDKKGGMEKTQKEKNCLKIDA